MVRRERMAPGSGNSGNAARGCTLCRRDFLLLRNLELLGEWMRQILAWQSQGKIAPVVARSFRFDEAPAAHRYIENRSNIGKVLLVP